MNFKLKVISNFIRLRIQRNLYAANLQKIQRKHWRKLNVTLRKSPFYKELAEENADILSFPLINKAIFMEKFNAINTCKIDREEAFSVAIKAETSRDFAPTINDVTIGLSSGTSGNRGLFLATENERAQWVGCVLDRVIGFSLKKRSVAFFLRANSNLYDSVKSKVLQFEFFDLFEPLNDQIGRLNSLQPNILVAQPSLLLELADKQEKGELTLSPTKIISVAEVLYPEDRKLLEKVFKQTIHQVYQCTEGLLATSCAHGTLHFNEDFLHIEKKYIDEDNKRFHPIITDLIRTSQPVIRYELNDIIHEEKNCPCGSKMTGIKQIEGRSDDVLRFTSETGEEVKIFPDFFRRAIIMSNEKITDYTLVQTDKKELRLYINEDEVVFQDANKWIQKLLSDYNINDVSILKEEKRNFEKGNKLRRIRNDYWKAN